MEAHAVMARLVVVQVRPWVVAVAPQWNPRQRVRTSLECDHVFTRVHSGVNTPV